jgi:hypothetical protein
MLNLGHDDGRSIVRLWHDHFMRTSDAELRAAPEWHDVLSDQSRLHEILRERPELTNSILIEDRGFLTSGEGSFIRHVLRSSGLSVAARKRLMMEDIAEVIGDSAELSSATLASDVHARSSETSVHGILNGLYQAFLDRDADGSGLQHYAKLISVVGLAEGIPAIVRSFLNSDEFRSVVEARGGLAR